MRIRKIECANGHMRMNLNKVKGFHKWVEALRSDKFKQAKDKLGSCEGGFCCLGVGNHIQTGKKDFFEARMPDKKTRASSWLAGVNDDIYSSVDGLDKFKVFSLACLNDRLDLTFQEIADCLEAVYIHGVLDKV